MALAQVCLLLPVMPSLLLGPAGTLKIPRVLPASALLLGHQSSWGPTCPVALSGLFLRWLLASLWHRLSQGSQGPQEQEEAPSTGNSKDARALRWESGQRPDFPSCPQRNGLAGTVARTGSLGLCTEIQSARDLTHERLLLGGTEWDGQHIPQHTGPAEVQR